MNNHTQEVINLHAQHVFGRNARASTTYLEENDVSLSHAAVSWENGQWLLHDHSRNGTMVNFKHVHHTSVKLAPNDVIQFSSNEGSSWKLISTSPPCSYLINPVGNQYIELISEGIDSHRDLPEVSFYFSGEEWHAEVQNEVILLEDGKCYEWSGCEWLFVKNEALEQTISNQDLLKRAHFLFELTPDEEHIFLTLVINDLKFELGERAYNPILLALARKRLKDYQDLAIVKEQGWMAKNKLIREVSKEILKDIDQYYLNVQIYRIRKYLLNMKPFGYLFSGVVERRQGELRFAHQFFQIKKENRIVGEVMVKSNISYTVMYDKKMILS